MIVALIFAFIGTAAITAITIMAVCNWMIKTYREEETKKLPPAATDGSKKGKTQNY